MLNPSPPVLSVDKSIVGCCVWHQGVQRCVLQPAPPPPLPSTPPAFPAGHAAARFGAIIRRDAANLQGKRYEKVKEQQEKGCSRQPKMRRGTSLAENLRSKFSASKAIHGLFCLYGIPSSTNHVNLEKYAPFVHGPSWSFAGSAISIHFACDY